VGAVVPSIAELLGGGEDMDKERGDEASTVARLDWSRWPEAHAVARRRSRYGGELQVVVVLLVRGCNRAPKHVSEKRTEEREQEEVEQRRKEASAHRNR
jgi:hypothetical protein